jgi:hypothetical protein
MGMVGTYAAGAAGAVIPYAAPLGGVMLLAWLGN